MGLLVGSRGARLASALFAFSKASTPSPVWANEVYYYYIGTTEEGEGGGIAGLITKKDLGGDLPLLCGLMLPSSQISTTTMYQWRGGRRKQKRRKGGDLYLGHANGHTRETGFDWSVHSTLYYSMT